MAMEFSEIPEDEWIDSNEKVFAICDNYPVTEGHVRIISKREIPTWFDSTEDEQRAIMSLICFQSSEASLFNKAVSNSHSWNAVKD